MLVLEADRIRLVCFGDCIPSYSMCVPLLVPVDYAVFRLVGAPCFIRFWMVVSGLFSPML